MIRDAESTHHEPDATSPEDSELLRRYAADGAEVAFAELVRRRIGLVYAVALRRTNGNRHQAEDATQAVFTDLARKASALAHRPVLVGWLHRSAQYAAAGLVRAEQRRRVHEEAAQRAETMPTIQEPEPNWDKVRPLLDDALSEMDELDRDAILLRFFDGRPFADIGERLRLTENAARMRVERALDKLNATLARRGINSTTAALGVALGHQIGAAMPAGLAASVTGTALAQTTATAAGALATFVSMSKLQIGVTSVVALAGATGYVLQGESNDRLRREIAALQTTPQTLAMLRQENQRLASVAAEVDVLRRDDAELKQLAQSVAEAQRANAEAARLERVRETERTVQAEIDRMNREGNAQVEEYKSLTTRSKNPALIPADRAEAENAAKLKLAAIQAKQREIKAYIENTRGATPPQFQTKSLEHRYAAAGGDQSNREQWTPAGDEKVSLRILQADHTAVFSVYERLSGRKVTRDASLAGVTGTFDLQTEPCTGQQMMQVLRVTLRERLNIWITPTPDGNAVATLGPPQ